MTDRADHRARLLDRCGWSGAEVRPLAGDASTRRYERLLKDGRSAILMDVAGDPDGTLPDFLAMTRYLAAAGLRPPHVLGEVVPAGYVLLEDLGDRLFARVLEEHPDRERPLYEGAVDVLLHLHRCNLPPLGAYDAATMADRAALAGQWYAGDPGTGARIAQAMRPLLETLQGVSPVVLLRDYHAENLIDLPDANAPLHRVGLLDYQDALLGHPAYDLVSLLQDARRDVSLALEQDLCRDFAAASGFALDAFERDYALLGAQRALRILGVFARLSLHFGKPGYVDLIPRVWGQLTRNLAHEGLADLRATLADQLPPPSTDHLKDLKDRCGTIPSLQ